MILMSVDHICSWPLKKRQLEGTGLTITIALLWHIRRTICQTELLPLGQRFSRDVILAAVITRYYTARCLNHPVTKKRKSKNEP